MTDSEVEGVEVSGVVGDGDNEEEEAGYASRACGESNEGGSIDLFRLPVDMDGSSRGMVIEELWRVSTEVVVYYRGMSWMYNLKAGIGGI